MMFLQSLNGFPYVYVSSSINLQHEIDDEMGGDGFNVKSQ